MTDFHIDDQGSLVLLHPLTALGRTAIVAVLDRTPEAQEWAGALVVEPRYVGALLAQLANDFGVT